ncbi:MAG TPA: twin-arginine translocase TatA/TatE family subunit [Thermoanaerobaculia bacterium]|jgi:sec-independent protein translocase protein TatA|nr:twin-arginine translocase TatA/TatE family subunit [Thermoanaerobaculia bacterium]
MPSLGVPELVIIFLIIVVLFGASRIPHIGRGLGEGIRNFKKGLKGDDSDAEQIPEKTGTRNS